MGVMDKFLNYMKLNGEDEDYLDEDYLDEDEVETPAPAKKSAPAKTVVEEEDDYDYEERVPARKAPAQKITPINKQPSARRVSTGTASGMQVCVIKPTSVEEAREITETLLSNRTVVLNLEGLDVDVAQRIIDFTSGSCFAIGGNLQKISHYIFIITPKSVDISGDFQDIFGGNSFEMPLNN